MNQKPLLFAPLIFAFIVMSCQSTLSNRSATHQAGQVQSVLKKNNFDADALDDLDGDPEAYTPSFFEQNDLDDDTIFSDAQNFLSQEEPLQTLDTEPAKICEDSIYYNSWKAQFDRNWLRQNSKKYRTVKARNNALERARSDAYLELAYSSLNEINYDFPLVINRQVAGWIDYFTGKGRNQFVVWLRRAQEINPLLATILERNGLPKDLVYLAMIESGLNNKAKSWVGAVGTWQFMPYTGKLYGLKINDWVDERRDPIKSTEAASRYLTDLYTRFGSWHLAAGAYNCGEGCISRKLRQYGENKTYFDLTSRGLINRQTANYVPKIIAAMIIAKNPEKFGFDTKNHRYNFTTTRTLNVSRSISILDLANHINVDPRILSDLNPSLRLGITPPRHAILGEGFEIVVPASVYKHASIALETLPDAPQNRVVQAKIPYRQSIESFAKRYNLKVSDLRASNAVLRNRKFLNRGQMINVPVTLGTGQYTKLLSVKKKTVKRKYTPKRNPTQKRTSNQRSQNKNKK